MKPISELTDEALREELARGQGWTPPIGEHGKAIFWKNPEKKSDDEPPNYPTDPGAALELLQWYLTKICSVSIQIHFQQEDSRWWVRIMSPGMTNERLPRAISEAVCAALRERGEEPCTP